MDDKELKKRLSELASKHNQVDDSVSSVAKAALDRLEELESNSPESGGKKEPLLIIGWGTAGVVFLLGHIFISFLNLTTPNLSITLYCVLFFVAFLSGIYTMFKCDLRGS